jgi:hypothetical protein
MEDEDALFQQPRQSVLPVINTKPTSPGDGSI